MSVLIKNVDLYVEHRYRVLLIGEHGVGKTYVAQDVAVRHGLKLKYYSCATLDPFTDLVGVPFPRVVDGVETLEMIRPREIDQAQFLFFDELNRADEKVQNAVMEIIQFGTINGERLPNLKLVWAAINPADDEGTYKVDSLDPALVDRFDVYEHVKPSPSAAYLTSALGDRKVAGALVSWWHGHNKASRGKDSYVSPRRLEKIGRYVITTGRNEDVGRLLPPGGKYDTAKLSEMLGVALGKVSVVTVPKAAAPVASLTYKAHWIASNEAVVVKELTRKNVTAETQMNVANALKTGLGAGRVVKLAKVWDALPGAMVEQVVNSWAPIKQSQVRTQTQRFPRSTSRSKNLEKALGIR